MNTDIIFTDALQKSSSIGKTTCPYCGVGCGVDATIENNKIVSVKGDENHPANHGRLCVKGSSLHETLGDNQRILSPRINGKNVSWQHATQHIADKFKAIVDEHGPDSVAYYLSGQLLTEDYYVANKLMKGFIGTGNVDTNSRLCMASASSAHKRAFGEDIMPCSYNDIDHADVIFMVGSNAAYAHPIVYQRIIKAKENNPNLSLVVLDPRATATSNTADLHIKLKAGTDAYYFNGLLIYLKENNLIDQAFINDHCDGFEQALATAYSQLETIEDTAKVCDVDVKDLITSYQYFSRSKNIITIFSQGINQSSSGVDKGNAIINCHLATGTIGYPGTGPFSITGQPNAMGGREVGGLSNQLAAHMDYETPGAIELVEHFWQAPNISTKQGYKAVDMFNAINDGKIKAIWIMATNPVVSMPHADAVKRALKKCDLVVVSDCFENGDTVQCADVVLPATTWGEKEGMVTNSERRMSLQKSLITPPGEARNDWQAICDVAKQMGFRDAFDYEHVSDIFKEHAALSGFNNSYHQVAAAQSKNDLQAIPRVFDISALSNITKEEFLNFKPTQWPINKSYPNGCERIFSTSHFNTPNNKARILPVLAQLPKKQPKSNELIMNTGRIRDQWHTMTRTGRTKKLMAHSSEPFIQIHPEDAKRFQVNDKEIAQLSNLGAQFLGRVHVTKQQRVGEIFTPIHWNDNFSASARASALVHPITDAICGQPEFKHSPVKLSAFNAVWSGYLVSEKDLKLNTAYWTKIPSQSGVKYILSDKTALPTKSYMTTLFPDIDDWIIMNDDQEQTIRVAGFNDDALVCFLNASTDLTATNNSQYIEQQLSQLHTSKSRFKLLSGIDAKAEDVGTIICSCFQIGEKIIKKAIASGQCKSVEQLGQHLKCGTNCGSCIPELKALFDG